MELNKGQELAVTGVLADMEAGEPGANIIGEGGTGKTFSTAEIIRRLQAIGKRVLLAAPTNKAVKALQKACRDANLNLEKLAFGTIHSALGLALMPSSERKHVNRVGDSILGEFDLIVLDESSMLNSILLENYIQPDLEMFRAKGKFIFMLQMGDVMQLPPPKETKSVAFELYKSYELTENQRQLTNDDGTPNGILQLCRALRKAIEFNKPFFFCKTPPPSVAHRAVHVGAVPAHNVRCVLDRDFLPTIMSKFDLSTDLEDVRVIAWRNDRINFLNRKIREHIYGKDVGLFEIDEQVVLGGPIKDDEGFTILGTDEECRVAAITESYVIDEKTKDEWPTLSLCLTPIYANVRQVFAHVIHPSAVERFNQHREMLAEKARNEDSQRKFMLWAEFHKFNDLFNDIRYCYAITAHRAQGSTYNTVIVDVKDMMDNPRREEAQRLVYVGWSRARLELITNKTQFII